MELEEIRAKAAELFPQATRFAITHPGQPNAAFDELQQLCAANFARLGYACHADFFGEIVPKLEGSLSLDAWSHEKLEISGWPVDVTMRPFYLGAGYVHLEIRHDGEPPFFNHTGYRSHFTPLATFAELTPEDYLALVIGTRPREQQMTLL